MFLCKWWVFVIFWCLCASLWWHPTVCTTTTNWIHVRGVVDNSPVIDHYYLSRFWNYTTIIRLAFSLLVTALGLVLSNLTLISVKHKNFVGNREIKQLQICHDTEAISLYCSASVHVLHELFLFETRFLFAKNMTRWKTNLDRRVPYDCRVPYDHRVPTLRS